MRDLSDPLCKGILEGMSRRHFEMFAHRLKVLGRWGAFEEAVRARIADHGVTRAQAKQEIAAQFGMMDLAREFGEFQCWLRDLATDAEIRRLAAKCGDAPLVPSTKKNSKARQAIQRLNATTTDLPPDLAWVYNHPKMLQTPGDAPAARQLMAADFNGAPSRGAAAMLSHFVTCPDEFFKLVAKTMISMKEKGKDQDKSKEEDAENQDSFDSLKEVQELFDQLVA